MEPVIVTATRLEEPISQVPSSVTIITGEEMERQMAVTVEDAIRNAPGVYIRRAGTVGASTSARIRGSDVTQTLVMIDGVEVNNSWSGFYDWANLTVDNVERVEIVRNAQSALYGSEAMGGVINIITKRGKGKPRATISAEGGTFNTYRESGSLGGEWGIANFATSVSRLDSDGQFINDDYRNTTLSARLGLDIAERASMAWTSRYIDSVKGLAINPNEFWPFPPPIPFLYDENRDRQNSFFLNVLNLRCEVSPWWDFTIRGSSVNDEELVEDQFTPGVDLAPGVPLMGMTIDTDSKRYTFGTQHNLYLWDEMVKVTGGFEYEEESAIFKGIWEPPIDPFLPTRVEKDRINRALYIQNRFDYEGLTFIAGARYDDDSIFGNKTNPKLSGSYLFDKTRTRLKCSWGKGFRAPTFKELFTPPPFGNPTLKPEESTNFEFGVDQRIWDDKVFLEAGYFSAHYKNLIQFSPSGVSNIGGASIWGVEAGFSAKPIEELELRGNITYLDTEDKETKEELPRRPRYVWYLNANYRWNRRLTLNLDCNFVGSVRSDYDAISPEGELLLGRNPQYTKVDLAASYTLVEQWSFLKDLSLIGRIENLLDEQYQEAKGFPAPGFHVSIGLQAGL
ncbi:MAG: TonB-dependent receptor [Syntrophobacterales bacterium]|nr:MAG: TonB-dependent receptor [Syntrophobacterales bacterium]